MDHHYTFKPIDIVYESRRETLTIFSQIQNVQHTPGITEKLDLVFNRSNNLYVVKSLDGLLIGTMPWQFKHFLYVQDTKGSWCQSTGSYRQSSFFDETDGVEKTMNVITCAYHIRCERFVVEEAKRYFSQLDIVDNVL